MKKIKKIIAVLLITVLVVLSFSACTDTSDGKVTTTKRGSSKYNKTNPSEVSYEAPAEDHIKTDSNGIDYVDNIVTLTAKDGVDKTVIENLVKGINGEIVGYIEITNDYEIKLAKAYSETELDTLIQQLAADENVESVDTMTYFETDGDDYITTNDAQWTDWDAPYEPGGGNWGIEAVGANYVWSLKDSMTPVNVGVIDNMFNTSHEDLNFAQVFDNPNKIDNGHGSHVSGIIAANYNNGVGISGVYPCNDNTNSYLYGYTADDTVFGLKTILTELIVNNDVRAVNYSYGFLTYGFVIAYGEDKNDKIKNEIDSEAAELSDFLKKLIDDNHEFVICSSAGNNRGYGFKKVLFKWKRYSQGTSGTVSGSSYSMANYNSLFNAITDTEIKSRIIVCGASEINGETTSTQTLASYSDIGSTVDIIAPGSDIESCTLGTNGYDRYSGTSMATPFVTGTAACLFALDNDLTGAEVKSYIVNNANKSNDFVYSYMSTANTSVATLNAWKACISLLNDKNKTNDNQGEISAYININNDDHYTDFLKDAKLSLLDASNNSVIKTATWNDAKQNYIISDVDPGTYIVSASCDGYGEYQTEKFTVEKGEIICLGNIFLSKALTDFTLPSSVDMTIGEITLIEPEVTPEEATGYPINWSSSDESVVSVLSATGEACTVSSLKKGSAVITGTVTVGGKTITRQVTVNVSSTARDTILVLDRSGSMYGTPLEELKKSAIKFCEDLLNDGYNNRVGLVLYDNDIDSFDLTDDLTQVTDYINSIYDGGTTDMADALSCADEMMKNSGRDGAIKNVVIMADGIPNVGPTSLSGKMSNSYYDTSYANAVIDVAESMFGDYNVYSLGFFHNLYDDDKDFARELMSKLTNKSDGYYEVDTAENLQFAFGDIQTDISKGSKIVINIACPVDVTVTYGTEKLCSSPSSLSCTASFGTLQILGKNKDVKVLSLDADKIYDVKMFGTDTGTMDYTVNYLNDSEEITDYRVFESVPLTASSIITSSTDNTLSDMALNIDNDGDGTVDMIMSALANSKATVTYTNEPEEEEIVTVSGTTEERHFSAGDNTVWIAIALIAVILIIVGVVITVCVASSSNKDKKPKLPQPIDNTPHIPYVKMVDVNNVQPQNQIEPPVIQQPVQQANNYNDFGSATGKISFIGNVLYGFEVNIRDKEQIFIGKDKNVCSIVIPRQYKNISRCHCYVEYDASENRYIVVDSSTNGVYVDGTRIQKGKRTAVAPGSRVKLSVEDCIFVLG